MNESERERLFSVARDTLLDEFPDALAIYAYGSVARGDEWPDSDLDLAILLPPDQHITDILDTLSRLAAALGKEVDLVDLRRAGDVLRREVLADGKTLFERDADEVLAWEASAMSRYARHREEIRELLEQFRRTGTGYAP